MSVLLLAEHNNQHLSTSMENCLGAAQQITNTVDILVAGYQCGAVAKEASELPVRQVLVADNLCYEYGFAENTAPLIATLAKPYSHIMAPASTFGKDIIPRLGALLGVGVLSDVITILDERTIERPIYAGNAIETVKSHDPIILMTIRPTAFQSACKSTQPAEIIPIDTVIEASGVHFCSHSATTSKRPELSSAQVVVCGGRGLKSKEQFALAFELADSLGAALGATRAAVDAGFVPNDYQVGQTGKIIAPQLYIGIGISGAIQHIAGIKDSKIIIAINHDENAPIFDVADYGLLADLFTAVPELIQLLRDKGEKSC
ncbi:MAG: etfA [Gammaproteobacteria bacterium]|jgi:electron transfer flavoprotein alpha subunit|nr:etfA [Gammaproteobacteria bacterium]